MQELELKMQGLMGGGNCDIYIFVWAAPWLRSIDL